MQEKVYAGADEQLPIFLEAMAAAEAKAREREEEAHLGFDSSRGNEATESGHH